MDECSALSYDPDSSDELTGDVIGSIVAQAVGLRTYGSGVDDLEVVSTGSRSIIVLAGEVAIRIPRRRSATTDLLRAQSVVDSLPEMPFDLPRSCGAAVHLDGFVGVPVHRLGGRPHEPGAIGAPGELGRLLAAIRGIDASAVTGRLAEPHAFIGGAQWEANLRNLVVPLVPARLRAECERRIDDLVQLPPTARSFSHGDLGGANVLWTDGRISGVLDWDLATVDDPTEDLASLASWHGWSVISSLASAEEIERAEVHRRSFPLQVVASRILQGTGGVELERWIERLVSVLEGA